LKDGYVCVVLVFRPGGKLADAAGGVDVLSAPGGKLPKAKPVSAQHMMSLATLPQVCIESCGWTLS